MRPSRKALPSPRKRLVLAAVVALAATALTIGVPFACGQRRLAIVTDGVIVDKRAVIVQSRNSPGVAYLLVIRAANDEQVSVAVPVQIYEKASVGMHAVKKAGHQWPDLLP
jgi:hypothetical protein